MNVCGVVERIATGGAKSHAAGAAATSAVVGASILILAFDYVLTEMFFAR